MSITLRQSLLLSLFWLRTITTFGNFLIVLSVWMDPLRKLRSSSSNFIIFSMAVADLLVGLVACPLAAFWGWALLYKYTNAPFGLLNFFATLINVSVGHILLFSIDRFFAVVTPLRYRAKVTSKRVCIVSFTCWINFLLFGFAFSLLRKHYALMRTLYNVQIFCILICIVVINVLTLYRFHKYSHSIEALDDQHAGVPLQMILQRERTVSKTIEIVISAFLLFHSLVRRTDDIVHLLYMQFVVVDACAFYRCRCHVREFCNQSVFVRVETS